MGVLMQLQTDLAMHVWSPIACSYSYNIISVIVHFMSWAFAKSSLMAIVVTINYYGCLHLVRS